jgi:hypothetical protein
MRQMEQLRRRPNNKAFSRLFDEDECSKSGNLGRGCFGECRENIMTGKFILAVALITPLLTVSSMAQQYQGGPKSPVIPTARQYAQGVDVYAPTGDIYAQGVRTNKSGVHRGSPRAVVPYGR